MTSNLFTYLKHEQQLLTEIVLLAEKQQKALIQFDSSLLEEIASYQDVVAKSLREAEEHRITLLMAWLKISRREAVSLRLSSLEKHFQKEELSELKHIRTQLRGLLNKLQTTNTMNRVLANRAKNSVKEILQHFTNGTKHVCNVKV